MKNQDYINKISEIDQEIRTLTKKKSELYQKWISEKCPVKIGDIVDVTRRSYRSGKMIVRSIKLAKTLGGNYFIWQARGPILLMSGDEGGVHGEHEIKISLSE